jgi:isoamylase
MHRIDDGSPFPLGANWDGKGVNFALFSEHATAVDLCLFASNGEREISRIRLPRRTDNVWHVYVEGLQLGQLYGYRVHGPYEPLNGHRFNPHKLLLDPYAKLLTGKLRWHDAMFGYRLGSQRADLTMDRRDSARMMPKCVVETRLHEWGDDRAPRNAWTDTVIYEAHVKGLTQLHPDVPQAMRGTYTALGHPKVIEHLVKRGITAIELMPVHAFVDDRFLVEKGLKNYWGYSTLGYFAPEPRYMGEAGVAGFRSAIRSLHDAGIEVILDVVYNHTCEGSHLGPTLSFRGIDNKSYYKLSPESPRHAWDSTGTGNTLDLSHPRVLQMVMDSLRHWVEDYHIDGFRFDLAPTLARDPYEYSQRAGFLQACGQDPVLSRVKLIAEPWDVGSGGYQVGGFPIGWSEWNDQYRDTVRGFWRGDEGQLPALARVVAGSGEIFSHAGRHPWSSVNFIASHDGYTLHDVVSYNERHNEANGEDNRDGHSHNLSWNCGAEGPTEDAAVNELRARQKRNFLATLMLSQGIPMLLMGDEISRTQGGNNNAYAQDNETSWMDWEEGPKTDPALPVFTDAVVSLRKRFNAFRRRAFFTGGKVAGSDLKDSYWLVPEGREASPGDWAEGHRKTIAVQFGNDAADGQRFLMVMNAYHEDVEFRIPEGFPADRWISVLDTRLAEGLVRDEPLNVGSGESFAMPGRGFILFQHAVSQNHEAQA